MIPILIGEVLSKLNLSIQVINPQIDKTGTTVYKKSANNDIRPRNDQHRTKNWCISAIYMPEPVRGLQNMLSNSSQNFERYTFLKLKDQTNGSKVISKCHLALKLPILSNIL